VWPDGLQNVRVKIKFQQLQDRWRQERPHDYQQCRVGVSGEAFIIHKALLLISTSEIQYMFSKAPTNQIPLLGKLLSDAVQTSHHWEMERTLEEETTDCLTTMIPQGQNQDISITLWVGREVGLQMRDIFNLRPTWSSSLGHLSLQL
jgi:hypothetical protein